MGPTVGSQPLFNTFTACSVVGENSVTDEPPWLVTHRLVPSEATSMGVLKAKLGPDKVVTKLRPAAFTTVTLSAPLLTTKTSPWATTSPVGSSKPKEGPEAVPTK